jgi:uncharacterized protein YggU (UPF0235/DUF167 family)
VAESQDLIAIRVRPRSSRSGLEKGSDGGIVVHVHAAAREGAANRECAVVLAKALGVAKSAVRIIRGEKGRGKQIAVVGLSAAEARARLDRAVEGESS